MSDRRVRGLVVLSILTAALVVGTGGTAQFDGSRTIEIGVADGDERPYLGVDSHEPVLPNGTSEAVPLLTVEHNLGYQEPLRVSATVSSSESGSSPTVVTDPSERILTIGEAETLTASVLCSDDGTHTDVVTVDVGAVGSTIELSFTESVEITCVGGSNSASSTVSP